MKQQVFLFVAIGLGLTCLVVAGGVWLIARDMGIHPWDEREVPVISISGGLRPTISFTPDSAYELSVYEGSENGDGFGVLWNARGPGGFENNLRSPVVYGIPPEGSEGREAAPLEAGQTYTIVIFRKDPLGKGDGFQNTRHRYEGMLTFVATEAE
jgi:hypothetical protein